jgi:hypothetical protein
LPARPASVPSLRSKTASAEDDRRLHHIASPAAFGVSNTTAASFSVGGSKKISFDYAGQLTGSQPNAIKIWAKASTANSGLTLANLKLKTPGMSVPKEFPEASIAVSRSSGPDFQQRLIAGVDFSSGSGQSVTLTGDLGMSFAQTSPRGSSLQFHVMAVYVPPVNAAPTIADQTRNVFVGEPDETLVQPRLNATDPDGDTLTWSIVASSAPADLPFEMGALTGQISVEISAGGLRVLNTE